MFLLINKRETGINLRRIMDCLGLSARDVQEYLGLGCVQSVYRWLDGHSMPTVDNLYALSELFQMPIPAIDHLLDVFHNGRTRMERVLNFFIVVVEDSLKYVHTSIMRENDRKRNP